MMGLWMVESLLSMMWQEMSQKSFRANRLEIHKYCDVELDGIGWSNQIC